MTSDNDILSTIDPEDAMAFINDPSNNVQLRRRVFDKAASLANDDAGKDPDIIKMMNEELPRLIMSDDALAFMDVMVNPVRWLIQFVDMDQMVLFKCADHMRSAFFEDPYRTFLDYDNANEWMFILKFILEGGDAADIYKEYPKYLDKVIQDWLPFSSRYEHIRDTLYRIVRDARGIDAVNELNLPKDDSSLKASLEAERRKFPVIKSLEQALDPSLSISFRRAVLAWAIQTVKDGDDPSKIRRVKEPAERVGNDLKVHAVDLVSNQTAPYFLDLVVDLVEAELRRRRNFKAAETSESIKWLVNLSEAIAESVQQGDQTLFHVSTGPRLPETIAGELQRLSMKPETEKVVGAFLKALDTTMPKEYVDSCMHLISTTQAKIDPESVPKLLNLLEAGSQSAVGAVVTSIQTDVGVFEPVMHQILSSTNEAFMSVKCVLMSAGSQGKLALFFPHIDALLDIVAHGGLATAGTALHLVNQLTTGKPELFATEKTFLKATRSVESNVSLADSYPIRTYVFNICGAASLHTINRDFAGLVIREFISRLEDLYDNHKSDAQFGNALLTGGTVLRHVAMSEFKDVLEPHKMVIETIANDTAQVSAAAREVFVSVVNELEGITISALRQQLFSTMHAIGVDPNDPFFEAVKNAEENGKVEHYDVMLSYNWSHQKTVLRIRDSLRARGLSVWMDLDQMSGNVYAKMAEAVLGSDVIIPCLTSAYEASGNCKRELGFAADQTRAGKKIVPVRLEDFQFTWSALITAGLLYTFIGEGEVKEDAKWQVAMDGLAREVRAALPERKKDDSAPPSVEQTVVSLDQKVDKVSAETDKEHTANSDKFDVMLSYNWAHQPLVLRIRDYLQKSANLKVWMDVDEMSGNVYGKMAEAVSGARVIVTFLTSKYEQSGNCRREFEFASEQARRNGKVLIPVKLEPRALTWTAEAVRGMECLEFDPVWLEDDAAAWDAHAKVIVRSVKTALGMADKILEEDSNVISSEPMITVGLLNPWLKELETNLIAIEDNIGLAEKKTGAQALIDVNDGKRPFKLDQNISFSALNSWLVTVDAAIHDVETSITRFERLPEPRASSSQRIGISASFANSWLDSFNTRISLIEDSLNLVEIQNSGTADTKFVPVASDIPVEDVQSWLRELERHIAKLEQNIGHAEAARAGKPSTSKGESCLPARVLLDEWFLAFEAKVTKLEGGISAIEKYLRIPVRTTNSTETATNSSSRPVSQTVIDSWLKNLDAATTRVEQGVQNVNGLASASGSKELQEGKAQVSEMIEGALVNMWLLGLDASIQNLEENIWLLEQPGSAVKTGETPKLIVSDSAKVSKAVAMSWTRSLSATVGRIENSIRSVESYRSTSRTAATMSLVAATPSLLNVTPTAIEVKSELGKENQPSPPLSTRNVNLNESSSATNLSLPETTAEANYDLKEHASTASNVTNSHLLSKLPSTLLGEVEKDNSQIQSKMESLSKTVTQLVYMMEPSKDTKDHDTNTDAKARISNIESAVREIQDHQRHQQHQWQSESTLNSLLQEITALSEKQNASLSIESRLTQLESAVESIQAHQQNAVPAPNYDTLIATMQALQRKVEVLETQTPTSTATAKTQELEKKVAQLEATLEQQRMVCHALMSFLGISVVSNS